MICLYIKKNDPVVILNAILVLEKNTSEIEKAPSGIQKAIF
jgi:hypothetical protein